MYVTVPTQLLHLVTELASCPLTPKSLIFTRPALFTSKLLGLTSLWTMRRFAWRYRRPLTICAANPASCVSGMEPIALVTSDKDPPSM